MGAGQVLVQAGQTHGSVWPRMLQHQGANHCSPGHTVTSGAMFPVLTSLNDNNSCYHTEISALQCGTAKQRTRDRGPRAARSHCPTLPTGMQELHALLHSAQESPKCLARSGRQVNSVFSHAERRQAVGTSSAREAYNPILQPAPRSALLPPALSCSTGKDG